MQKQESTEISFLKRNDKRSPSLTKSMRQKAQTETKRLKRFETRMNVKEKK